MKFFLPLSLFVTLSIAQALPFTVDQIPQVVKSPQNFKAWDVRKHAKGRDGIPITLYQWGAFGKDAMLLLSPKNADVWELILVNDDYTLDKVAPQRKLLSTADTGRESLSIYLITEGALKSHYILESKYYDGSYGLMVETHKYIDAISKPVSQRVKESTPDELFNYPLYGLLKMKGVYCKLPKVNCL